MTRENLGGASLLFQCPVHDVPLEGRPIWYPVTENPDDMSMQQVNNDSSPGGWIIDASEMWCPKAPENVDEEETLHSVECTSEWEIIRVPVTAI